MAMTKKKKALIAFGCLTAIGGFCAPSFAKIYCEKKYNITVSSAHWANLGILFNDVSIDRKNIKANLNKITFHLPAGPLIIDGGNVSIIKTADQNSTSETKNLNIDIYANNLRVDLKYNDINATLEKASYTKNSQKTEATVESGHIIYNGYDIVISKLLWSKESRVILVDSVETNFYFPIKIPALKDFDPKIKATKVAIWPNGVTVNGPKTVFADLVEYGPFKIKNIVIEKNNNIISVLIKEIEGSHPWLGLEPVTFSNLKINANDAKHVNVAIGNTSIIVGLNPYSIHGSGYCEDWMQSIPSPLPEALQQSLGGYSGSLEFEIAVEPKPTFYLNQNCKFKCSGNPIKALFEPGGFVYTAYDKNGKPFQRRTGNAERDWTLIDGISSNMQLAVTTLEDPYFYNHNGIIPSALQNSFMANLQSGRFMRGGSTITMQLAKNLWLTRQKTILRKVQEALLTFALESCLSKEQILELYLNIVEFGPDIYGIRNAAKSYFNKPPHELTPEQAFYLAMILPAPKKAVLPDDGGLLMARGLMKKLAAAGAISEDMVEE